MSHRTQITLTDAQYERLRAESERTGVGLAELVRRALDRSYGLTQHDTLRAGLEDSFGSWTGRDYDGSSYVDGLRRGMARRLADA
ncbi:MAG: ribbon-helix-helix domain-containing protein [Actinomycetota bacterium]|nr:ribbon-helix-helix domain-containing protein [Actinomycetota bacterium]